MPRCQYGVIRVVMGIMAVQFNGDYCGDGDYCGGIHCDGDHCGAIRADDDLRGEICGDADHCSAITDDEGSWSGMLWVNALIAAPKVHIAHPPRLDAK